jgi:hypothetical protein
MPNSARQLGVLRGGRRTRTGTGGEPVAAIGNRASRLENFTLRPGDGKAERRPPSRTPGLWRKLDALQLERLEESLAVADGENEHRWHEEREPDDCGDVGEVERDPSTDDRIGNTRERGPERERR